MRHDDSKPPPGDCSPDPRSGGNEAHPDTRRGYGLGAEREFGSRPRGNPPSGPGATRRDGSDRTSGTERREQRRRGESPDRIGGSGYGGYDGGHNSDRLERDRFDDPPEPGRD